MPNSILSPVISNCTSEDFYTVKKHIAEFCLDDNDLHPEQFLVAKYNNTIIGFGRLRIYKDSCELCSLGVLENFRLQGVGSQLSDALVKKSKSPLYTVTIIPEFFERLGFRITQDFPSEVNVKLNYCTTTLTVPENYVVMRYF